MATLTDISKKCHGTCTCYVNQDSGVSATRNDITQLDKYGYCTHSSSSNKLALYWKTINLETTSGIPFTQLKSVTTYYHSQYEPGSTIKRPILIRIKYNDKYHWYENAGHHTHKRWRKIGNTADYPKDDNYDSSSELKDKLTDVGCRLYGYHQIDIHYAGQYSYTCLICQEQVTGKIDEDKAPKGAAGYTKYTHWNITDKSILVHNGNRITYKKRDSRKTYYLPIPINDSNIKNISAYYWDKDKKRSNPLLIQVETNARVTFWFENISKPDEKNGKWIQLNLSESETLSNYGTELQKRLNILNCNINRVVEIQFGVTKCHNSNSVKHKNRIDSVFTRIVGTSIISSYEYTPSNDSRKGLFIVSKFFRNSKEQTFPQNILPLEGVEKLIYYMSPCDIPNPFLVYVELDSGNRWFKRTNGDTWQEYSVEFSNQTPENVTNEIITLFDELKTSLGISECPKFVYSYTSATQLDIRQTPKLGDRTKLYNDRNTSILVTKTERDPICRFFKNTHSATQIPFDVDYRLQDGEDKIGGNTHKNVSDFSVYFWEGAPETPILIGISKGGNGPKYYGKNGITNKLSWRYTNVDKMTEQQALDHQNCVINNAIPFDIKDPLSITASNSLCLNNSSRQIISGSNLKPINLEYEYYFSHYMVRKQNAKISRVTFDTKDTNIEPPVSIVSQIIIYYWGRRPSVPLMVEFRHNGGDSLFERSTFSGIVWKSIDQGESQSFYLIPKKQPTQQFITKLDTVSCTINRAVKIDISKKDVKYCHNKCLNKRIYSKRVNSEIPNYTLYEHISAIDNENTFIISSIYNGDEKQNIGDIELNLGDVEKVAVYFPACNERFPIYMRIYHVKQGVQEEKWLERTKLDKKWTDATAKFQNKNSVIKDILDNTTYTIDACNKYALHNQGNLNAQIEHTGQILTLDSDVEKGLVDYGGNVDEIDVEDEIYEVEDKDSFTIPTLSALVKATPGFTIYIKKIPNSGDTDTYTLPDGKIVQLVQSMDPQDAGFVKFKHTKSGGGSFKLEKVMHDQTGIDYSQLKLPKDGEIEHLAVWYWEGDKDMINPLLIEVQVKAGEYRHIKNDGKNTWVEHARNPSEEKSPFQGEPLEQKLDNLNCKLNDAVTMDISYEKSKEGYYCCDHHGSSKGNGKIIVHSQSITITSTSSIKNGSLTMEYHKHSVIDGESTKLVKIKYYKDEDKRNSNKIRKRVIANTGLTFPTDTPVDVYVFYCGYNPALIYTEQKNNWHKRRYRDDYDGKWIGAGFSDIVPDRINNGCKNWNRLKEVLDGLGCSTGECHDIPGSISSSSFSSVTFQTPIQDPKVTIQLSQKPTDEYDNPRYYPGYDPPTGTKKIKVTGTPYLPIPSAGSSQNFFKYEHKDSTGVPFELAQVLDDQTSLISGIKEYGKKITSVAAYYWKHEVGPDKKPGNVLLVEVVQDGDHTENKYYYYAKNGSSWEAYAPSEYEKGISPERLIQKLTLLNCEINDVVQIDVTKTPQDNKGEYCHDENGDPKHDGSYQKKVKVTPVSDERKLGNYTAYVHTPNTAAQIFSLNISGFTKGDTVITLKGIQSLPLRNTNKVVVYFCKNGPKHPLLIYLPDVSGKQWFRKPDGDSINIWSSVSDVSLKDDTNNKSIVNFLDTLDSTCKPPLVTINIYNRPDSGIVYTTYYGCNQSKKSQIINVNRNYHRRGILNGFTEYTHRSQERASSYFNVNEFTYNGGSIKGALNGSVDKVKEVSVYYWSILETRSQNNSRPLLIKVTTQTSDMTRTIETYYENDGDHNNTKWTEWHPNDPSYDLTKKLHLLNCKLNNAVIIDVSKHPSNTEDYDACDKQDKNIMDKDHSEDKIQVTKENTPENKLGSYEVYTHKLNHNSSGQKFHILGFKNNGVTLSDILATPDKPILNVDEVKAYFCGQELAKPLLFYYNTNGKHHWYKNTSDNDNPGGSWEKETSELSTINDNPDKNHDKILQVLNSLQSKCNSTPEPTAEPLVAESVGITAILTGAATYGGPIAGAGGLTGLGWWAFKRSRGDPWVRQI